MLERKSGVGLGVGDDTAQDAGGAGPDGSRRAAGRAPGAAHLSPVAMRRWVVRALGVVAVLAVVLGVIGWIQYGREDPAAEIDALAVVYGTMGLFVLASDVQGAPVALAVARVLAPLVPLGAFIAASMSIGSGWRRRRAARSEPDRVIALGPGERVAPYLQDTGGARIVNMAVRGNAAKEAHVPVAGELKPFRWVDREWDPIGVPQPSDWVEALHAASAARCVVATGSDELNLHALGAALHHGVPGPGRELLVELDDRSAALRLSVALSLEHPERDIEVVCRSACVADAVAERLLPREDPSGGSLAVVGDGDMVALVARAIAKRASLLERTNSGISRPELHLAGVPRDVLADMGRHLPGADLLHVVAHDDCAELMGAELMGAELMGMGAPGHLVAFVDCAEPDRTARLAVELAAARPDSAVFVALGEFTSPLPGSVTSLDSRDELEASTLVGPLRSVAEDLGSEPPGAAQVTFTTAEVRSALRSLVGLGVGIVPENPLADDIVIVPSRHVDTVADALAGADAEVDLERRRVAARRLAHSLRLAGLAVVGAFNPEAADGADGAGGADGVGRGAIRVGTDEPAAAEPGSAVTPGSGELLSDDRVKEMAERAHVLYENSFGNGLEPGDAQEAFSALEPHEQAQNCHQVRWIAGQLEAVGYRLALKGVDDAGPVVQNLPSDVVEALARREHDRWVTSMLAAGYDWGERKDHDVHTHPYLVCWDDLPETRPGETGVRDKDSNPIRHFPDVCDAAGLVLLPPAETAPPPPTRPTRRTDRRGA